MGNTSILEFAKYHWAGLLALWLTINVVLSMPSPNGAGPTSTWWYKWIFNTLHGAIGALPRILAVFFPNSGVTKLITQGSTDKKEE